MPTGRLFPDLAKALVELRSQKPKMTAYGVHVVIVNHPERYGAPVSFSYKSVENAFLGKPITRRTNDILTSFVRSERPDLMPEVMPRVQLNLAAFLNCRGPKMMKAADAIRGDFQTYAVSTTATGYLRRGHIAFDTIPQSSVITMSEMQVRPDIEGHPAHAIDWEGYVAPKGEQFFAVLRTVGDTQEATPLFYAIRPTLRDPKTQKVISLIGIAMHFEPERFMHMFPTVYMVRRPRHAIHTDFVPLSSVIDDGIRKALCLPEKRKTASRRKSPIIDVGHEAKPAPELASAA